MKKKIGSAIVLLAFCLGCAVNGYSDIEPGDEVRIKTGWTLVLNDNRRWTCTATAEFGMGPEGGGHRWRQSGDTIFYRVPNRVAAKAWNAMGRGDGSKSRCVR